MERRRNRPEKYDRELVHKTGARCAAAPMLICAMHRAAVQCCDTLPLPGLANGGSASVHCVQPCVWDTLTSCTAAFLASRLFPPCSQGDGQD